MDDLARRLTGLDGWWASYQLDSAITFFGVHVENKLAEHDTDSAGRITFKYESPQAYFEALNAMGGPLNGADAFIAFAKAHGAFEVVN